jgi:hypothetical protein
VLAARTHGAPGAVTDDLPADADRGGGHRHQLAAFALILGLAR